MSARAMLRLLLVLQALAAGAIAALLAPTLGWGAGLLAGLAAVVLVRALVAANNFVMSARAASLTPEGLRPGWRGWLRLWGGEFAASMLQSSWHTPRGRPQEVTFDDGGPPVLLLHGYGCNSGYWHHLRRRLTQARISHACIDLEPLMGDIDDYADQVEAAARRLCQAARADAVIIVAHSMGGLVARAWQRRRGASERPALARLITLGSPHHGTVLANLGMGVNAAQMRRSKDGVPSAWLASLAAQEDAAARARITSIYSHHDNIVAPQTSSVLEGASNVAVGGVGHVALGRDARVLDLVMAEIAAVRGNGAVGGANGGQRQGGTGKLAP